MQREKKLGHTSSTSFGSTSWMVCSEVLMCVSTQRCVNRQILRIYRVIQRLRTILNNVGEIIWSRKCRWKFLQIRHSLRLNDFLRWHRFHYSDFRFFLQNGNSFLTQYINWHVNSLFAVKKKLILPSVAFLIVTSDNSLLSTFLIVRCALVRSVTAITGRVC
jgi:hypothetical protein